MTAGMKESDFEAEVVGAMLKVGYQQGDPAQFDRQLGMDPGEILAWIAATQDNSWKALVTRYGGDAARATTGFCSRVSAEIGKRGIVDVFRSGVRDQGILFELAAFRPATSMNATHAAKYAANRLIVVRQLGYSPKHGNTIDLGLLLNGILVATAELKNKLTGQDVAHAMSQYKTDRDPGDPVLGRALVHFAVDQDLVYMTTKLAANATEFLPFNRGHDGGRGNPPAEKGYGTAYLWEQVWERDAWLDILARFVQHQGSASDSRVIFPRYHQWDAVRRMEDHARANGSGQRYLIQHSTGSGKSKTISWLAHRLASLHDAGDAKVFDKIIVITDRRVLDEQLRADVANFERVKGTVVSVTGEDQSKSADLAAALGSAAAKIVVTTLQVFPYLLALPKNSELASRRYAVIVDEAHSSQTGDAAAALRQALGAGHGAGDDADPEEALTALVAARGHQPNISFFAFTATPKDRTIEVFGTLRADGTKGPFHLYSMRQAIEETFILDVLKNYTTYKAYFKLAVANDEAGEKEVEVGRASSALRKMVVSNPDVIAAKAKIIVEHFRAHTSSKIGGLAKAMVVTDSRAGAVRYKRAIDAYIAQAKYTDIRSLVAFSGTVNDDIAGPVTESSLNTFPESQTAARFRGLPPYKPGDYQVLIVAEKFQTGFDEPLLHTMFVDKVLTGLNTVQTLSRLNRSHPKKSDTFVLDFRNDADAVRKDFQRYYQATSTTPTDPNALTDAHDRLILGWPVIDATEVRVVVAKHFGGAPAGGLGAVYAAFNPTLGRFAALSEQDKADFRAALDGFLGLYSFMSQVLTWTDADLERTYIFGKALAHLLPRSVDGALEIGDDVVLTHLRLEVTSEGAIGLEKEDAPPGSAFPGEGRGRLTDPRFETLAEITEELNKQFALNLTDSHRLAFQQFEVTWLADQGLRDVARANTVDGFRLEFERKFKDVVLDTSELNDDLYRRLYSDDIFRKAVVDFYVVRMYQMLRDDESAA